MPTKLEEELLAMAAAERQRNEQPQTDELPDLDPEMFMPASARREARAVQSEQQRISALFDSRSFGPPRELIEEMLGIPLSARTTSREVPIEIEMSVNGPDADWVREELRRGHDLNVSMGSRVRARISDVGPNQNGDDFSDAIASIFMTPEARAQAELSGIPSGMDDEPIDLNPRRSHYTGDGQVVSQRGADGRWNSTGIQPMSPQRAASAPISPRPTYPTPRSSNVARRPPRAPERPVDRSRIPSALDRIIGGKGPFDDR